MLFDLKTVAQNIRKMDEDDLLLRVTVYRSEMEPAALDLMEQELAGRGVSARQIANFALKHADIIREADGAIRRCHYCERPAVSRRWGWHRLWGKWPLFPWKLARCEVHDPQPEGPPEPEIAS